MNALLILIPITLVLAGVAVGIFFLAVNHAQFEDLDTPKVQRLLDGAPPTENRDQRALSQENTSGPRGRSETGLRPWVFGPRFSRDLDDRKNHRPNITFTITSVTTSISAVNGRPTRTKSRGL